MEGLNDPPDDLSPRTSCVSTNITYGNSITDLSQNKMNNEEEDRSNEFVEHADEAEHSSSISDTDSSENDLEYETDSM